MPAKDVVAAFKRFDKDGSGSISRQELAAVLKGLNPTAWDDASIDRLMRGADRSGDGLLQIEEFVEWVFAAMKVDSSVGSEYHLDRVTKEQETKMIEEIFTHFDLDEDGFWNYKESATCQMWMDGTQQKEETFVWMVNQLNPGRDTSKGLSKANLVELYTNKSYQMNISKDHAVIFSKVRMAEDLFEHFDVDKDGHWNMQESIAVSKATFDSEGPMPTEEEFKAVFGMIVDTVGGDKVKGLTKQQVVAMYSSPKWQNANCNIGKDYGLVFTKPKLRKMAEEFFDRFDADRDGHWNFAESTAAAQATNDAPPDEETFLWLVEQVGGDKSKGLSKLKVVDMYTCTKFKHLNLDIKKDYDYVFPGAAPADLDPMAALAGR
ncbi:Calmodulin (CaM) [Durusdinium trenchii]